MCGRFACYSSLADIRNFVRDQFKKSAYLANDSKSNRSEQNVPLEFYPSYNICPALRAPCLLARKDDSGNNAVDLIPIRWHSRKRINSRIESWVQFGYYKSRRCVLVCNGYLHKICADTFANLATTVSMSGIRSTFLIISFRVPRPRVRRFSSWRP